MQIFDITLNITGLWCIDRAYPQWFGAKVYKNNSDMQSGVDSSDAINNAIKMKLTGEVFLPRGIYKVNKTIKVRCGIILTGEPGIYGNSDWDATILIPGPDGSFTNGGTDKYFVRVNVKKDHDDTWEVAYPSLETRIKHLFFRNIFNVSDLRCILILGAYIVDNCTWREFDQAIQNGGIVYSDSKKVTNCSYSGKSNSPLYAFNLEGIGEALIFEHNHIIDQPALRLALCNGGSITSNILNGNVLIEGCKAIVFHSNHMEAGAQLTVKTSNVTTMNNFFHKKTKPSLILVSDADGNVPVVHSSGDMFVFYEKQSPSDTEDEIVGISEYDVQIDNNSLLQLTQTYRY